MPHRARSSSNAELVRVPGGICSREAKLVTVTIISFEHRYTGLLGDLRACCTNSGCATCYDAKPLRSQRGSEGAAHGRSALLRGGLAYEGLARHVWVPVYECALGIFLPRPDVQRVEGREPETIGRLEVMEDLSHELRRNSGMDRVPCLGVDEKVGACQFQGPVWLGLVEHDLGTRWIQFAGRVYLVQQVHIGKMEPHGSFLRSAHAAE